MIVRCRRGFSVIEILVVVGLLGILAAAVFMNVIGSDTGTREQTLKANVGALRNALDVYKAEHGWYPCTSADWNRDGNATSFAAQMTQYTNAAGQPSRTKSATYKYGPCLRSFPWEPFSGLRTVTVDTTNERLLSVIGTAVAASNAAGGWYYEAKSGNICANLGSSYPPDYAKY